MDKENIYEVNSPLFEGVAPDELVKMLDCTNARISMSEKGDILLREQGKTADIGVLLKGEVRASRLDPSGKQLIISHHLEGSIYGDILSLSPIQKSPVTVTALTDVTVLLIPVEGVFNRCAKGCECHDRLIRNMLRIVSHKYFELQERLVCVTRPTLREKLLFFLERAAATEGRRTFNIPFDRAALAEYLNAERSALSRELSAMKRGGLIDYYKNSFKLL